MKKFVVKTTNLSVLTLILTLVLTSCSGEDSLHQENPLPEGLLTVAASENIITVSEEVFATESGESYDVASASDSASVTAVDGNVLTAKAFHGNVTNLTTNYGEKNGNRRTVTVIAYGKAENGEDLRSTTSYTQEVVVAPEPEDEYTYQVKPLRDRVDNTEMGNAEEVKNAQTYEIIRLKNGTPEKSWKISFTKWSYLYSRGAVKEVYTAADPKWQASVSLIEGDAKNSLGDEIKLAHGTTSGTKALKANIFDAEGAKIGEDMSCIVANEVTKIYYGDITFMTTANARVSAECTFQLITVDNVIFTDPETGHSEVIGNSTEGTLSLAGTSYEENPEMSSQLTGSDGKIYTFKGDYTVSVNVNINTDTDNNTCVFTSKTKYHTYSWTGK